MATSKRTKIPQSLIELLDVAIFQFGTLSGLRLSHKLRGDPVIEGVAAVFAQIIACAKKSDQEAMKACAPRLGNWKPGMEPTKQLRVFISSRIRATKDEMFREKGEPAIPEALVLTVRELDEMTDTVVVRERHPRCWRCRELCRSCQGNYTAKAGLKDGFKPDLMSPFLEVNSTTEESSNSSEEENEEDELSEEELDSDELYEKFKGERLMSDDDDGGEKSSEADGDEEESTTEESE